TFVPKSRNCPCRSCYSRAVLIRYVPPLHSMSLIVMKFGGTSVGSAERIRQAANIVHQHARRGDEVVVVVSALSKVTDLIIKILNSARLGKAAETEEGLEQLRLRHQQVLEELCQGQTRKRVAVEV